MSKKRAHKTLSLEEKLTILEELSSKTHRQLAEKYGVGVSTVADIRKKGDQLRERKRTLVEMGCQRPVKTMKIGNDQQLEMAVFLWFKQKREEGVPITGKLYMFIQKQKLITCHT